MPPNSPQPPNPNDYSFIMNPAPPPKRSLFPASAPQPVKIFAVIGAFLILLIVIAILKSVFSGGSDLQNYVGLTQDQQQLIHLATNASSQSNNMSASSRNFAVTTELSLTSAQTETLTYLKANHKKVSSKDLNLKLKSTLDQQLEAAASAGTYDETFQDVMQQQLKTYQNDLKRAYLQAEGPKGRALIKQQYAHAQLLGQQLTTP